MHYMPFQNAQAYCTSVYLQLHITYIGIYRYRGEAVLLHGLEVRANCYRKLLKPKNNVCKLSEQIASSVLLTYHLFMMKQKVRTDWSISALTSCPSEIVKDLEREVLIPGCGCRSF